MEQTKKGVKEVFLKRIVHPDEFMGKTVKYHFFGFKRIKQ